VAIYINYSGGVYTQSKDPIGNLHYTAILIKLRLNFDKAGTNNAMTHVVVLSAKARRKKWLK
jgi:hypothetical protein